MQLRQLQDQKANLERLVDELVDFSQLDTEQVRGKDFEFDKMRLVGVRYALIISVRSRISVCFQTFLIVLPYGGLFIKF